MYFNEPRRLRALLPNRQEIKKKKNKLIFYAKKSYYRGTLFHSTFYSYVPDYRDSRHGLFNEI